MVDVYRTEDEQVEALKKFWDGYGSSILTGILVAAVLITVFKMWKDNNIKLASVASENYQQMVSLIVAKNNELTEEEQGDIQSVANSLRNDFPDSNYARYAAILMAKVAVENNDLVSAEQELNWVLESKPDESLKLITTLRLSRILFARGEKEKALSLLESADAKEFTAGFEEAKGDFYSDSGRFDDARIAYAKAQEMSKNVSNLLKMKVEDLMIANAGKTEDVEVTKTSEKAVDTTEGEVKIKPDTADDDVTDDNTASK